MLYPNDTSYDGKVLRVRQQYFFVSASIQDIISQYKAVYGHDFSQFAELRCFQLNDTHPVIGMMNERLAEYRSRVSNEKGSQR